MELSPTQPAPAPLQPAPAVKAAALPPAEQAAHKTAQAFEATFLAEMLQYTGINAMPDSFGGGVGEEAFGSFLTEQYAKMLAERGGVGIAEQVFEILKQRTGA
jgi:peptidoglycan hydrolase FlgJ